MNAPSSIRPSISVVTQRVDETLRKADEVQAASDTAKANIRLAAAMNYVEMCRDQAGRDVFTDRDAQGLKIIASTGDELFRRDADDACIPAGFGPAVRSVQSGKLAAVARELEAIVDGAQPAAAE